MKKNLFFFISLMLISFSIFAQEKKLYDAAADAKADIEVAVKKAAAENKFVVLQAGGNWCSWCLEFAKISKANPQIDSLINSSFVWYELNFSKENKNEDVFSKYGYPQRFGFPVFIILDAKGHRIHTQNSEYLEDGKKSYDQKKVFEFLQQWTPKSLAAENYK
ncbi:thioredoxin family protein [Ferruginibacter paludis]|uniref:thioredoxin family protein n=1 Tax=Ferruginibacter paludis TaxID=1310417 RepID=UPI0025B2CACC|nr:thioredoxin family protein [Ferruginibacter paludis]MDN3654360.1 thioredoxin family protein [Ferruginibacter paludis]